MTDFNCSSTVDFFFNHNIYKKGVLMKTILSIAIFSIIFSQNSFAGYFSPKDSCDISKYKDLVDLRYLYVDDRCNFHDSYLPFPSYQYDALNDSYEMYKAFQLYSEFIEPLNLRDVGGFRNVTSHNFSLDAHDGDNRFIIGYTNNQHKKINPSKRSYFFIDTNNGTVTKVGKGEYNVHPVLPRYDRSYNNNYDIQANFLKSIKYNKGSNSFFAYDHEIINGCQAVYSINIDGSQNTSCLPPIAIKTNPENVPPVDVFPLSNGYLIRLIDRSSSMKNGSMNGEKYAFLNKEFKSYTPIEGTSSIPIGSVTYVEINNGCEVTISYRVDVSSNGKRELIKNICDYHLLDNTINDKNNYGFVYHNGLINSESIPNFKYTKKIPLASSSHGSWKYLMNASSQTKDTLDNEILAIQKASYVNIKNHKKLISAYEEKIFEVISKNITDYFLSNSPYDKKIGRAIYVLGYDFGSDKYLEYKKMIDKKYIDQLFSEKIKDSQWFYKVERMASKYKEDNYYTDVINEIGQKADIPGIFSEKFHKQEHFTRGLFVSKGSIESFKKMGQPDIFNRFVSEYSANIKPLIMDKISEVANKGNLKKAADLNSYFLSPLYHEEGKDVQRVLDEMKNEKLGIDYKERINEATHLTWK